MVALLTKADGEVFATGVIPYLYQPATLGETTPRIMLRVLVEGMPVTAVVDTGSPYVLCPPYVARHLGLSPLMALGRESLLVRGHWLTGHLQRLNLQIDPVEGETLNVEATAFVPDLEWEESWDDLPFFIGLSGCLERIRFALDPREDMFYFGSI